VTAAGPVPPTGFASGAAATAHVVRPGGLPDAVHLGGDDGHHLQRVRRIRVGEAVTVADGAGRWRRYDVAGVGRGTLDLVAAGAEHLEPALTPALTVACAVGKGTKPDAVVADLTELGVDRIVFFRSARSVVRWDGPREAAAAERFAKVAREAAGQCRRARLPEIVVGVAVGDLPGFGTVVVGSPGGVAPVDLGGPGPLGWCAVVGAEGGLAPDEEAVLAASPGAGAVAVGPHVLRTETAAVAVAAALVGRRRPAGSGPSGSG